ncbi:MAG: hypothetical protein ACW967_02525 [Candidatus Hodarchaeales archaeon]|jgi:hypothetical protein
MIKLSIKVPGVIEIEPNLELNEGREIVLDIGKSVIDDREVSNISMNSNSMRTALFVPIFKNLRVILEVSRSSM